MAANSSDHNYYSLDHRRHPSQQQSAYDPSAHNTDDHLQHTSTQNPSYPPSSSYAYRQSTHLSPKRPVVNTNFEQYVSDASLNGFTSEPPNIDSPDPHEFYRQYRDSFIRREPNDIYGQADIAASGREDGMTTSRTSQRSTPTVVRMNGYAPSTLASRVGSRPAPRSSISPLPDKGPLLGAKSHPQLTANTPRNRQTSLQDLVNKFNQTPDEVPPLPSTANSRSNSVTKGPTVGHGYRQPKSRIPSDSHQPSYGIPQRMSSSNQSLSDKSSGYRKKTTQGDRNDTGATSKADKGRPTEPLVTKNMQTAKSMVDLSPSPEQKFTRRPLFGEVFTVNESRLDPGYGISTPRPRRGSEGSMHNSMHNPNPMFPNDSPIGSTKISPSSPTAWYLGVTPSLEGINLDKPIPARPPGMHRRSRSDFSGSYGKIPHSNSTTKPVAILSPAQEQPSPIITSPNPTKRNSQSRIPVSTRRTSITSESGNSSPSTRANSAANNRPPASRAISALQKPKSYPNTSSPDGHPKSSPARKSPKRRNLSPLRKPEHQASSSSPSPSLKAYISAPMPLKSPPLRSSRPRQPVSTATTSASRARAVEHLKAKEGRNKAPEHKPRNLPELGGVDFAARRQRIQQAFITKVQEQERKDEIEAERIRVTHLRESQYQDIAPPPEPQKHPSISSDFSEGVDCEEFQDQDEHYDTPVEEMSRQEHDLAIHTNHQAQRSVLDLAQEDSPTLGNAYRFTSSQRPGPGSETPPSDIEEPKSAATTGTNDTFFDNEPQEESPIEYRTILTHVLALRESSSENSPVAQTFPPAEKVAEEKDDREEIQIMLGATPVVERASEMDKGEGDDDTQRADHGWRGTSWSSSVYSNERQSLDREKDGLMERIDEHAPEQEDTTHNSLSTVSSTYNTQQPWSPESSTSVVSPRTTLDGESYNPINKVLEHYHESDFLNPEAFSDNQQRLSSQPPNLARAGGWDPKKVTQLYLQSLARTKYTQANAVPEPLKLSVRTSAEVPPIPTVEEPAKQLYEPQEDHHEQNSEEKHTVDYVEYEEVSNPEALEVEYLNPQRASLNNPDDWAETSPSFLDWIHNHPTETPIDENPPPARHWSDGNLNVPRHSTSQHSGDRLSLELPQIERTEGGLGIDIHVEPPHDRDSPILPSHFPQPSESNHSSISILPSTTYTRPPPTSPPKRAPSVDPPAILTPMIEINTRTSSIDSSNHPESVAAPASLPRSSSTSRSREQPSIESTPAAKEASAKAPPTPEQKRLTRRRNIIKELVDTEHSFGQDMKVVDDIYKGTSNGFVISSEDVKILFGNSDQIVQFSTTFLDALKQASKSVYVLPKSKRWRNKRDSAATSTSGFTDDQSSVNGVELGDDEKDRKTFIGEAFSMNLSQMEKVYADYLKNHDAANQKLQALQKNDKVQVWLKECRNYAHDLTTAWDLDSLLVKPVQRILKYPLLLKELLEVTPDNHPDFTALDIAAREMVGVSKRINEMKKRADIIEQVASGGRKRKDSDGRIGLTKAFGRRTEKLRQQVGLSDSIQDREYNNVSEKFGLHFFQLQVVMRDAEMYTTDVGTFVNRFNDFVQAIDGYIDVGQSTYPEVESKWRKFRVSMREILVTALTDHINAIRKNVIDPMTTLLKLHDGPQKLMQKRAKRVMDYARYKAIKERGDKPDKKTAEQGEQFVAINETLKDELPKLFALTAKLVEACLNNFVQLQLQWQIVWRKKLSHAIDSQGVSNQLADIVSAFSADFQYVEAQALSLGICNGSLLAETANLVNLLSPSTTLIDESSPRQSSSSTLDPRNRGLSISSEVSPSIPPPDFGTGRQSDGLLGYNPQAATGRRIRANSSASTRSPATPEIPGGWRHYSGSSTPSGSYANRPSTSTGRSNETPLLPRLSVDTPSGGPFNRLSADSQGIVRPPSTSGYGQREALARPEDSAHRYSGFFSSAMPMSDSPMTETPAQEASRQKEFKVLFLAASVYEFNIDRSRKEAGYPYLTYIAGEIFDVIGEKGELWLAKNQDDETCQVGWIWNKHFAKLAS